MNDTTHTFSMEGVAEVGADAAQQLLDQEQIRDEEIEKLIALFIDEAVDDVIETLESLKLDARHKTAMIFMLNNRLKLMITENKFSHIKL